MRARFLPRRAAIRRYCAARYVFFVLEATCAISTRICRSQRLPFRLWFVSYRGFLSPFGDMTLWNILASYLVIPYISSYPCVTNLKLWGHIFSVAPETSLMEEGARFHLNIGHHRSDPLVT